MRVGWPKRPNELVCVTGIEDEDGGEEGVEEEAAEEVDEAVQAPVLPELTEMR